MKMKPLEGHTTPDCVPFSFEYMHDGVRWQIDIPCYSYSDAEARARLLNLTLVGQLLASIPADGIGDEEEWDEIPDDRGENWDEVVQGVREIEEASRQEGPGL